MKESDSRLRKTDFFSFGMYHQEDANRNKTYIGLPQITPTIFFCAYVQSMTNFVIAVYLPIQYLFAKVKNKLVNCGHIIS